MIYIYYYMFFIVMLYFYCFLFGVPQHILKQNWHILLKLFQVTPTEEKIDVEKLKVREQIMFYEEITLFEDELADHGCAILTVKMVRCSEW